MNVEGRCLHVVLHELDRVGLHQAAVGNAHELDRIRAMTGRGIEAVSLWKVIAQ
jgi:hypothetical protein